MVIGDSYGNLIDTLLASSVNQATVADYFLTWCDKGTRLSTIADNPTTA